MNFEEHDAASTDFGPDASAADHLLPSTEPAHPQQRGISLSSTLSDNDWVSPFTLPPLPALRRNRDHPLKTPEHLRQREGSEAYYAAAWGSPYASPSPEHNTLAQRGAGHSIDLTLSSPQANPSFSNRRTRHSVDIGDVSSPEARRRLRGTRKLPNKSERPNWLSDSEHSDEECFSEEQNYTPKSHRRQPDWTALSARSSEATKGSGHQATDSVDTVTPDNFQPAPLARRQVTRQVTARPSRLQELAPEEMVEVEEAAHKRLPSLPPTTSLVDDDTMETRPRIESIQSFQRQKKRVTLKNGKNMVIALPMTDRESFGLPPVMTMREIKDKIDALLAQGWDTDGFDLTTSRQGHVRTNSGQSRPAYPETEDIQSERKMRQFTVHIPDQREWEDLVNYLQEEKLRALGVSPSNSEAPPSVASPFSQPLSRNSSKYTGTVQSPPVAPSSAASNPLRATSNSFSPTFSGSSGFGSQVGSGASSQCNSFPAPMHTYKQSVAMGQGRGASPLDYSAVQPNAFGQVGRSPVEGFGRRQTSFSPAGAHGIQSLGEVLSPNTGSGVQQHPPKSPQSILLDRPPMPPPQQILPRTPTIEQLSRSTSVEIQHPTPRSHRHNLSATLQKEIDDAEAALEKQEHPSPILERRETIVPAYGGEKIDEEHQDELPILKRPETVDDDESDIITNPSIAPSPLLEEDKNPFTNWQALSDAARGPQQPSFKGHKAQPSVSKLNVQAKEFDPTAGFKSSNFSFTGNAFQPVAHPFQTPLSLAKKATGPPSRTISASRFNVEAPSFVPGGEPQTTKEASPFGFSSAIFNVEAPEFNPDKIPSRNFKTLDSTSESERPAPNSIFGNVKIDPDSKVSRRTSKALPIVRPRSKDGPSSRSSRSSRESSIASLGGEDSEDETGRVTAPTDRMKRARRAGSEGNRSPVFADSAPFRHTRILSEIVNDLGTQSAMDEKPKEKPIDGWAYVPADEAEITHEKTAQSPLSEYTGELPARRSPFKFRNEEDAVKFSEAAPGSRSPSDRPEEEVVEVIEELSDLPSSPMPFKEPPPTHKTKFSLSALAKPFEIKMTQESHPEPQLTSKPPIASGLAASRWANSSSSVSPPLRTSARLSSPISYQHPSAEPSSPISHRGLSARLSSPPAQLEPIAKDETDEETLRRSVKVTEELSDDAEAAALSSLSEKEGEPTEDSVLIRSPQFHLDNMPDPEAAQAHESDQEDEMQPSFEEIDAVMKQFESNPDLGIERTDSPIGSTPLVDMRLASNFRSDAPSPSPGRNVPREVPTDAPSAAAYGLGLGIHRLNTGKEEVSDWNEELSTAEEDKLQSRARFFDGHVKDLVDSALENRLGPLERTLQTIQHSLALMATRPQTKSRRSTSTDKKDSDADDEDDYDAFEGFSNYRSRSPDSKRNRRTSRIRAAVAEGMAAYKESMPQQPTADLSAVMAELAEMRELVQQPPRQAAAADQQKEMKAALDEVISSHPRLRGSRVQQDHEASDGKAKLQIDGLEAMLKHEQERADHESLRRRKADEEIELFKRALENAEAQAAEHKESAEQAEQRFVAFVKEKDAYRDLEHNFEELSLKNDSLEKTLEEHRKVKGKLNDDIKEEHRKNNELSRLVFDVKDQLSDRTQRCYALHTNVERLQEQISSAVTDLASEQADWRTRENELRTKMSIIENALDQATRHSEKVQLDMNDVVKQHKEAILYKDRFENMQTENSKAQDLIVLLRNESRANEDRAYRAERELAESRSVKDADAAATIARLTAVLEGTKTQLETHKTDSDSQILRLQSRLGTADQEFEDQKVKHDTLLAETHDAHTNTVRELNEKREQALEEQHAAHERKLGDLRERHTRAMHNSSDDRHRMEHQFNEKLNLSEDKVKHLEDKLSDIEERLEITKSAARAAVEAATAKGMNPNNLPTPANSVVASPPTRAASASLSIVKGEPEKIPVQSLRESIMVLQDQLQNREQKVELLEAELKTLDKEAPAKIRERETEVQWLRELLAVRVDDIQEIIATLASPDFDRESVKDAAIRLKANIQMEQQIRDNSTSGQPLASALPSLSQVAAYAQSPRQALPLVATAAWGNFRKARQYAGEMGGNIYEQYVNQTPSKSTNGSPASFLSGIMTPPNTSAQAPLSRQNSNEHMPPPPTMRPLAAAAAARKAQSGGSLGPDVQPRPLRGYSSQPRALGKKINTETVNSNAHPLKRSPSPHTPTMSRGREMEFGEDVDEDASPLGRVEARPDETVV